jgi:hypothetical protein
LETYLAFLAILLGTRKRWQWVFSALKNILLVSALFFGFCLLFCGLAESYFSLAQRSLLIGAAFLILFTPIFLLVFPVLMLLLLILTRRAVHFRKPIDYVFFANRIETHATASDSTLEWAGLVMIRETSRHFLLYFQKNAAFIVPKRCFSSASDIDALRTCIRENFKGKTHLRGG